MKSKKKLLIAMAAMSVAAIGAGTVSTFAWYTAQAAVSLQTASDVGYSPIQTISEVSLENVNVTITIAKDTAYNEAKDVQLTAVEGDNVLVGGMANSVEKKTRNWNTNNSTEPIIGKYKATASCAAQTGATLEALKNKSYTFDVSAAGNVVILDYTGDGSSFTMTQAKTALAGTPTVTVSFNSDGAIVSTCTLSNPYYRIETNNPNGMEVMATPSDFAVGTAYVVGNEVLVDSVYIYRCTASGDAAGTWEARKGKFTLLGTKTENYNSAKTGGYKVGDGVYDSTAAKYYVAKTTQAQGSVAATSSTDNWKEVKLHSVDSISVADGQVKGA